MFGEKENNPQEPQAQQATPPAPVAVTRDDVYVMPEKFLTKEPKSSGKPLVIALVVLVLLVISTGIYFLFDYWQRSQLALKEQANNIENQQSVEEDNQPLIEDPGLLQATTTEETATSTSATTTEAIVTPTSTTPVVQLPPTLSPDSDNDGLTDIEEGIIGTSPTNPDTDGDGYKDGSEILSSYSPKKAGGGEANKLVNADFIKKSISNFMANNFSFLTIKDWPINFIEVNNQAVIAVPTGEVIRISVKDNPNRLSAVNWYSQLNPGVILSQLKPIQSGNLSGVFSDMGLQAYLTDETKSVIYVLDYSLEAGSPFKYPAIFSMMASTLTPVAGNLKGSAVTTSNVNNPSSSTINQ